MDKFFIFLAVVFGILLPTIGIVVVAADGTSNKLIYIPLSLWICIGLSALGLDWVISRMKKHAEGTFDATGNNVTNLSRITYYVHNSREGEV